MASQPGQQTIFIRILPNIFRSKSNQIMIFGQLKIIQKCGEEASPFSGK